MVNQDMRTRARRGRKESTGRTLGKETDRNWFLLTELLNWSIVNNPFICKTFIMCLPRAKHWTEYEKFKRKKWIRNSVNVQVIYNVGSETTHMFIAIIWWGLLDEKMGLDTDQSELKQLLLPLISCVSPSKSLNLPALQFLYLRISENICILCKIV